MGPVEHHGDQITGSVSLAVDDDGYFGRECPECERGFKLMATEYEALPDDQVLHTFGAGARLTGMLNGTLGG